MAEPTSRIAQARRRASGAKQTAVAFAAAGFLAIALLARQSHPGQASSASHGSSPPVQSGESDDDGFSLQPGAITQGGGSAGSAQTSVS